MDEEVLSLALERGQQSLGAIPDVAVTPVQVKVVTSMEIRCASDRLCLGYAAGCWGVG